MTTTTPTTPAWPSDGAVRLAAVDWLPPQPTPARVKVLHVITKFWAGAGGNTLLTVLGTDLTRYESWVAGCQGGPLWERAEQAGITTVKLRRFRETISPLNDLYVLAQLIRLIRRERPTIVHTHSAKAGFLGRIAAWVCHTPVIIHTFHGLPFHDFMSRRRKRAYLLLDRLVLRMTDAFLAVAPRVAREAVEHRIAKPGGITVIPSAVELDQIPLVPDPSIRMELGIPPDAPLIGTVGRLEYQKAPLDFVHMAAQVAKARPNAHFVMVGDGPLVDPARAEARRLDVSIHVVGFRSDAPQVASAFDVFVISSLYEGLGRALTEAVASGRPVVATAVNGVPDLIVPGTTGLLATPGDPSSLARSVLWMLDHPAEARRMGQTGSRWVRWMFDPTLMCTLIDHTYSQLLGLPGPNAEAPPQRAHQTHPTQQTQQTQRLPAGRPSIPEPQGNRSQPVTATTGLETEA
jgi:glycosyltransferase involved in cell wall biosynthesis